jgi:hypothetical protein
MAVPDGWPSPRFGGAQNPAYRAPSPAAHLHKRLARRVVHQDFPGHFRSAGEAVDALPGGVSSLASRRPSRTRCVHRVRLSVLLRPGAQAGGRCKAVEGSMGRTPSAKRSISTGPVPSQQARRKPRRPSSAANFFNSLRGQLGCSARQLRSAECGVPSPVGAVLEGLGGGISEEPRPDQWIYRTASTYAAPIPLFLPGAPITAVLPESATAQPNRSSAEQLGFTT